jgi:hypothetical protein
MGLVRCWLISRLWADSVVLNRWTNNIDNSLSEGRTWVSEYLHVTFVVWIPDKLYVACQPICIQSENEPTKTEGENIKLPITQDCAVNCMFHSILQITVTQEGNMSVEIGPVGRQQVNHVWEHTAKCTCHDAQCWSNVGSPNDEMLVPQCLQKLPPIIRNPNSNTNDLFKTALKSKQTTSHINFHRVPATYKMRTLN